MLLGLWCENEPKTYKKIFRCQKEIHKAKPKIDEALDPLILELNKLVAKDFGFLQLFIDQENPFQIIETISKRPNTSKIPSIWPLET